MSSPSVSSSASSLRTVDDDTSMPARSTSDFDPTGWPVATCSSTTRRRISRLREESCSMVHGSYPGAAGAVARRCRDVRVWSRPRRRPLGARAQTSSSAVTRRRGTGRARVSVSVSSPAGPGSATARPPATIRSSAARSTTRLEARRAATARRGAGRASPAPAPSSAHRAARAPAAASSTAHRQRGDVAADRCTVAAALLPEGRHRPDPDAEVVAPMPVA